MNKTQKIIYTGIFSALTAIGAFISIPFGPISFTLQSYFVLSSGMILGAKLGALSQVIYILLGLIGLPIFSGYSGGLQTVFKPSFGFLIGFIFSAYLTGYLTELIKPIDFKKSIFIGILGSIPMYFIGLPYMHLILNNVLNLDFSIYKTMYSGMLIFLPTDLLKIVIMATVQPKILKQINH